MEAGGQRTLVEGAVDRVVPAGAVGAVVGGDEDLGRLHLPGDRFHLRGRRAGTQDQAAVGALVELGQAAGEEGQAGGARC